MLKACIGKAVKIPLQYHSIISISKNCRNSVLAESAIGSQLVNQPDPELPSEPRTATKPQNKFVDTVSVSSYIRSKPYDETHRPAAQTMPMEWNLLVQTTGPYRPVMIPCNTQDNFKNPLCKILGCILSKLAGLPGPISANGVEFRSTVG